jgi:hypothetical protein
MVPDAGTARTSKEGGHIACACDDGRHPGTLLAILPPVFSI